MVVIQGAKQTIEKFKSWVIFESIKILKKWSILSQFKLLPKNAKVKRWIFALNIWINAPDTTHFGTNGFPKRFCSNERII